MSLKQNPLLFLGLLIVFSSCDSKTQQCNLSSANNLNKLHLVQRSDKCGEWGGDKKHLIFYRKSIKGQLLADAYYNIKECSSNKTEEVLKLQNIVVSENQVCLINQAISALANNKLTSTFNFSHSGYSNSISLTDSSIVIIDFPSIKWTEFDNLFNSLTE